MNEQLTEKGFLNELQAKMYSLSKDQQPIGLLRWNLFWEHELVQTDYDPVMTSTQVDETAQQFYRKVGYQRRWQIAFNHSKP